ncbi:MAG TPA: hypothetical protein VHO50_04820 [Bacteroidales bacterium]|nr:hypothetical protein [Bacteroidales bacterium]
MEIKSLHRILNNFRDISEYQQIQNLIKQASDIIKEALLKPDEDSEGAIQEKKAEIQALFIKNEPVNLGYESYSLFRKLNKANLLGKPAADRIEEILKLDHKSAVKELKKFSDKLLSFVEDLNRLSLAFDVVIDADIIDPGNNENKKMSLFLYFEGPLKIQSITELDRYSRLWDGILQSFSKLTSESLSPLDICSFNEGNTVLAVNAGEKTINALMEGVSRILDSVPSTIKIRQLQKEISTLNLCKNINELLDEEIVMCLDKTSSLAASEIFEKYHVGEQDDLLTMEISKSLKQVLSFIEKGGRLEFDHPDTSAGTSSINKLLNKSIDLIQDPIF